MNLDFTIAAAVIGVSALILHYKSHVKFVAMGVFIGLALLQIVSFEQYFTNANLVAAAEVATLIIPALILGVNHTVDKRKGGGIWTAIFVLIFTLFFLSSLISVSTPELQQMIMNRSIIGWQILNNHVWFTLAAAVLILIDSIKHRTQAEKTKAKKSK